MAQDNEIMPLSPCEESSGLLNTAITHYTYLGISTISCVILMLEILMTRIFSVILMYHFAFVAISIAMLGTTIGALLVYLLPSYFTRDRTCYHCALYSILFSLSIALSFLVYSQVNINIRIDTSLPWLLFFMFTFCLLSIPFILGGICVCLVLTRYTGRVSSLYGADLAGAAAGCCLLVFLLGIIDAPTIVIILSCFASAGALFFALEGKYRELKVICVSCICVFAFLSLYNAAEASKNRAPVRLKWSKGHREGANLLEKWNSFSRVVVHGDTAALVSPISVGISSTFPRDYYVQQLKLDIDSGASTEITRYDQNHPRLEYLRYDIANLAHYLKRDARVLIIGVGGGRDVLSALVFRQKRITGVEINQSILDALNGAFGDFSGHLDRIPGVSLFNDEGRSFVSRHRDEYDIIQVPFIDTWAATAAGGFVLTENSLYTVEAWTTFLTRLSDRGVLTFSRWYYPARPGEVYRLTTLAVASLRRMGVHDYRKHIVIAAKTSPRGYTGASPDGIATILVNRKPFSEDELNILEEVTRAMGFHILLSPRVSNEGGLAALTSEKEASAFIDRYPINIAAPTDDTPFFFHMLRLRDIFDPERWKMGIVSFNMKAVTILGMLMVTVTILTLFCIVLPLLFSSRGRTVRNSAPFLVFFLAIGFAFMFLEISQMQRLMIFLGNPTYSLSVVLFSLLLAGGIGSLSTRGIEGDAVQHFSMPRLIALIAVCLAWGIATPPLLSACAGLETAYRVAISLVMLVSLGVFMGMAFPLGMKLAAQEHEALTPWLWGLNGVASVCASVLATAIALTFTISTTYWAGCLCYIISAGAFFLGKRKTRKTGKTGDS